MKRRVVTTICTLFLGLWMYLFWVFRNEGNDTIVEQQHPRFPGSVPHHSSQTSETQQASNQESPDHVVVVKPNSAAVVTTISKLPPANMPNPAIVVLHYNRIAYLTQTLESLVRLPGIERFKVYLSQDGPHADAEKLAQKLRIEFINRPHDKLLDERQSGTAHLAQHYKWALDQLILPKFNRAHSHVIMVEDDMIFSPDFLHYFQLTAPLLDTDPTLWCVSSWNDLGVNRYVSDARRLFRTDFFSGLGWMLNAKIWQELSPIFPLDQWDWWMRGDVVSKGRDCIVPEVSRNKNIGEFGVNLQGGPFFEYLKSIAWNEATDIDFGDLSYLRRDHYDAHITDLISRAINTITPEHAARSVPPALPIVTSAPQVTIINQQFAPHAKLHGLNARPAIRKLLAAAMEGSLPHLSVDDLTRFFEFDDQIHSAQDAARSEQLQHEFQQKSEQQSTGAGVPASHPHFPGGFLGFSNEPMALTKLELLASKAVPFSRNSPHQMSNWWARASTLTSRFFSLLHMTSSTSDPEAPTHTADQVSRAHHSIAPTSSKVFLLIYHRPHWRAIASRLHLTLENPRSMREGLIILRVRRHFLLLADSRLTTLLPTALQTHKAPTFTEVKARQSESCTAACARAEKRCDVDQFQYVNTCSALKRHFPCEKGCLAGMGGQDIPNYVSNPIKPDLYQLCLTTEFGSTCEGKHDTSSRLCPCY